MTGLLGGLTVLALIIAVLALRRASKAASDSASISLRVCFGTSAGHTGVAFL